MELLAFDLVRQEIVAFFHWGSGKQNPQVASAVFVPVLANTYALLLLLLRGIEMSLPRIGCFRTLTRSMVWSAGQES